MIKISFLNILMDNYKKIYKHYEKCFDKNGDTYLGVDWPNEEDMIKRYKIMLNILKYIKYNSHISLLDFGAGCGGLYEYIQKYKLNINYEALDISNKYCEKIKEKFPNINVLHKDILDIGINNQLEKNYDVIVLNGVFTEKRDLTDNEMWIFFTSIIKKIWKNTNKGICFNIMTPIVDWKDNHLFYLSRCFFLNESSSK